MFGRQPVRYRERHGLLHDHLLGVTPRSARRGSEDVRHAPVAAHWHRHDGSTRLPTTLGTSPIVGDLAAELVPEHHAVVEARKALIAGGRGRRLRELIEA